MDNQASNPSLSQSPDYRGKVRVFGRNMLAGPLFESADVAARFCDTLVPYGVRPYV